MVTWADAAPTLLVMALMIAPLGRCGSRDHLLQT